MTCGDNVDRFVLSVIHREREESPHRGEKSHMQGEGAGGGHNIRRNLPQPIRSLPALFEPTCVVWIRLESDF